MAKTIRRNPMSVSTVNLDEKYINFMEYKGLCTNKNYVTIDQETFSEVNNMYVNQDNELSTRPPIKNEYTIDIITDGVSTETVSIESILDIKRINDKVFYHIKGTDSKYYLLYPVGDNKYKPLETSAQIYLMWFNYGYALFTENDISLIFYGKDNTIEVFKNADAVYIPITKVITGATIEVFQSENVFTSSSRERYTFKPISDGVTTPTENLIGKPVTIIIGDEVYNVTFKKYQELTFYKKVGTVPTGSNSNWHYQTAKDSAGNIIYVASSEDASEHYISVDGVGWYQFTLQSSGNNSVAPKQYPVLSDDGTQVFCFVYTYNAYGLVYYKNINIQDIQNFASDSWQLYDTIPVTTTGPNYIAITNSLNTRTTVYPLCGYLGSSGSLIDMVAFGTCTNKIVSYAMSFQQTTTYKNFKVRPDYYTGFLLFITDGEHNGDIFLLDSIFDSNITTADDLKNSEYACNRLDNKLSVFMIGDTGYLSLALNGYSYNTGPEVKVFYTVFKLINRSNVIDVSDKISYTISSDSQKITFNGTGLSGDVNLKALAQTSAESIISIVAVLNASNSYSHTYSTGSSATTITGVFFKATSSDTTQKYFLSCIYTDERSILINDTTYYYCSARIGIGNPLFLNTSKYDIKFLNSTLYLAYIKEGYVINESLAFDNLVLRNSNDCYFYESTSIKKDFYQYQYNKNVITDKFNASDNITSLLVSNSSVFTNNELYYNKQLVPLLKQGIPLYNGGTYLVWYGATDGTIYSNQYGDNVVVDNTIEGQLNYIIPEHSIDFITSVFSSKNVLYTSSKNLIDTDRTAGKNLIYVPVDTSRDNVFTDNITGLVNFSQTALGVFLETCAYELTFDSSSNNYYLTKTKLQLGNKRDSDILLSYDGNNIFITNIKGLSALNYQDFVQSTEQIYKYLTENIIDTYVKFATGPIKLCQYKDYLILYKTNDTTCLIYDLRAASWWKWTFEYAPNKIIYDGTNLLFLTHGEIYVFDFNSHSVLDNNANPFDWSFTTQKLHFGAPNNYKHIRSVSIVTEQNNKYCRFKLKFINYRNLNNLSDTDTVEYDIDQLTTMIKKVNFIKTNAFQFQISNDNTDKQPKPFITSNISIKYRITERLR